eukprot:1495440-Rhodomonas_salina.1
MKGSPVNGRVRRICLKYSGMVGAGMCSGTNSPHSVHHHRTVRAPLRTCVNGMRFRPAQPQHSRK